MIVFCCVLPASNKARDDDDDDDDDNNNNNNNNNIVSNYLQTRGVRAERVQLIRWDDISKSRRQSVRTAAVIWRQ